MAAKKRLDKALVAQGKFISREKARAAIMAGLVFINNERVDKPGYQVDADVRVTIKGNPNPYVSRGGLKLAKAIKSFGINLQDKIVMDIGASTGGFTDCALQNNCQKVYAVDVGYGQLAWSLRQHPKVVVMERTNIRYLTRDKLEQLPDFIVIDVSFISLAKILHRLEELAAPRAQGVALIKPQFEAGPDRVGKKGVVRDPAVHIDVIKDIIDTIKGLNYRVLGLDHSPIKGPQGNIEYLIHFLKDPDAGQDPLVDEQTIKQVVAAAHRGNNDYQ